MKLHPYLSFEGRADEAIRFYEAALGANVELLMRFGESPEPIPDGMLPPGFETKVMHASLRIGDAFLMLSDGGCRGDSGFAGISLSLDAPDVATATRFFEALAADGAVRMPLAKTFWAPIFGIVVDKFGVTWMIGAEAAA